MYSMTISEKFLVRVCRGKLFLPRPDVRGLGDLRPHLVAEHEEPEPVELLVVVEGVHPMP